MKYYKDAKECIIGTQKENELTFEMIVTTTLIHSDS